MAFSKWKTTRFLGVHVHTAITCLGKFVSTWGPSADLKWIFLPVEQMCIYIYIKHYTKCKKKGPPTFFESHLVALDYILPSMICAISGSWKAWKYRNITSCTYRGAQQEYWGNFPGDLETKPGIRSRCIREVLDLELEKVYSNKHQL